MLKSGSKQDEFFARAEGQKSASRKYMWWLLCAGTLLTALGVLCLAKPDRPQEAAQKASTAFQSQIGHTQTMLKPAMAGDKEVTLKHLYECAGPSVVYIEVLSDVGGKVLGYGSGFIVKPGNLVVTCAHVVNGMGAVSIINTKGTKAVITEVEFIDEITDIALIRIPEHLQSDWLEVSPQLPAVGEKVCTIGAPKGLNNTLTEGVISQHRLLDGTTLLQTSTPISPGSSGGPLLNMRGVVVGVSSSGLMAVDANSLNFAVSSMHVQEALTKRSPRRLTDLKAYKERLAKEQRARNVEVFGENDPIVNKYEEEQQRVALLALMENAKQEETRRQERAQADSERKSQIQETVARLKGNWRRLKEGMTQGQVKQTLGEPAQVSNVFGMTWDYRYEYGVAGTNGHVNFGRDGRLSGWSEPYWSK